MDRIDISAEAVERHIAHNPQLQQSTCDLLRALSAATCGTEEHRSATNGTIQIGAKQP